MAEFYIFNNGLMTANTMSGSDQRVLNWARIFSERHNKVNIFTSISGAERFKSLGFNVYLTGRIYLRSNIGLFFVYLCRAVKSCMLQGKIKFNAGSIIYSSSDLLADVIPAIYTKLKHKAFKLVVGVHLIAPNPFKGFRKLYIKGFTVPSLANIYYFIFQRTVLCILRKYVDLVLVSNEGDRLFLIKKRFSPSCVMVTYGAYDRQCIEKVIADNKIYDAIYVGRFHLQKGFPDLLKAWKGVIRQLPNASLVVIGEDISAGDIESFIKENKLEKNIRFLGYVGGEKKYYYLKSSKLLIFPSYYESFGIVALEAMACGLPVVAYDLPLYREIYPGGMLKAKIGDTACLASYILDLLTDESLRQKLSQEASELSKNFSWGQTARDILDRIENR